MEIHAWLNLIWGFIQISLVVPCMVITVHEFLNNACTVKPVLSDHPLLNTCAWQMFG